MRIWLCALLVAAQDGKRPGAPERIIDYKNRKVVACTARVAVIPDADGPWFEATKERFEKAARALWKATRGQMALVDVKISDRSEDGDLILENLDKDRCDSREVFGYWDAKKRLHYGGRFQILTFLHEWGHVKFDLPEEYGKDNTCECLMSTGKTIRDFYCDATNHKAGGPSCWERIVKAYPGWSADPRDEGDPPPLNFVVDNR